MTIKEILNNLESIRDMSDDGEDVSGYLEGLIEDIRVHEESNYFGAEEYTEEIDYPDFTGLDVVSI